MSSPAWGLTGNAGTNPNMNSVGTTDDEPLVIKTNGAERVRIDAAGNVGVGTTAPQKPLDVAGAGGIRISQTAPASNTNEVYFADNGQIRSSDDSHRIIFNRAGNELEFREYGTITFSPGARSGQRTATATLDSAGGFHLGNTASIDSRFDAGVGSSLVFSTGEVVSPLPGRGVVPSERVRIDSRGNVGIGTPAPQSPLHIRSLTAVSEGATGNGAWANIGSNSYYDGVWKRVDTTKAGVNLHMNPDDGVGQEFRFQRIEADGTNQRNIAVLGSRASYILESNVGIGTSTPETRLHVNLPASPNPSYAVLLTADPFANPQMSFFIRAIGAATPAGPADFIVRGDGFVGIGTANPTSRLHVNGDINVTGDVLLTGADCAEYFDASGTRLPTPGTVVVIDENGALLESQDAYDKKVAGVVSGAGEYRHGLVLDKGPSDEARVAVALAGKVCCKVDAQYGPIRVGDLLTTSATPGHAMKASDQAKAFGTVIGKALKPLERGKGLIPILVALQ